MVGLQTLTLPVGVRIPVPQPSLPSSLPNCLALDHAQQKDYNNYISGILHDIDRRGVFMQSRVGIREAKINLSKYLKFVKNGNEVILTDRGRPVGKIVPVEKDELSLTERIKRLEDIGVLERKKENYQIPAPLPVDGSIVQQMLQEDRNG